MSSKPYMPFYTNDYLADTSRLTTTEHGAYLLLIIDYWNTEKPLPDDIKILSSVAKMTPKSFQKVFKKLRDFFVFRDGFYHHKRLDKEIAEYRKKALDRASSARNAAKSRWKNECVEQCVTHSVEQCVDYAISESESESNTKPTTKPEPEPWVVRDRPEGVDREAGSEPKKIRSEPKSKPPDTSPVFLKILARKGEEFPVTEEVVTQFEASYPALDVRQKLLQMRTWSLSNPAKRKSVRGMMRFINEWFRKDNDRMGIGLETRKLSAVEHNQLLLQSRVAARAAGMLEHEDWEDEQHGS